MGNDINGERCMNKQNAICTDTVETYSKLINMGCDETISIDAANKYPNDLNKAIDFVMSCDKQTNMTMIDENDTIIKEGYLYKQSLHFKTSRKRWIVLKEKYLYSYQHPNSYQDPTEIFDLTIYDHIDKSQNDPKVFVLISSREQKQRHFAALSSEQRAEWIKCIKKIQCLFGSLYDGNIICRGIKICTSIRNIIRVLLLQKQNNDINVSQYTAYLRKYKKYILNDYHHILDIHLNEDCIDTDTVNSNFKTIYNEIMNNSDDRDCCDVRKCKIYSRSNRQREREHISKVIYIDDELCVMEDILDSIHCYFMHSVDIGYRILSEVEVDNNVDDKNKSICYDEQLCALQKYLISKRKHIQQTRGFDRIQHNKFTTEFVTKKPNKTANDDELEEKKDDEDNAGDAPEYNFGARFEYCWQNGVATFEYINHRNMKPKYNTLKKELISNKIFCLDKSAFDFAYKKAAELHSSKKIKSIVSSYGNDTYYGYGIPLKSSLNIANVLCVLLYTDYDTLSYNFTTTFRKISKNDNLRDKNQEYGNWTKILTETVNCFGTSMKESKIKVLYHGVSFMYITDFIATFNSPTSTTSKLQIAAIFSKNDGIILELAKYNSPHNIVDIINPEKLKYFNCSFISSFSNEDERLFIQPPSRMKHVLQFVSIRNMLTGENYGRFIKPLTIFVKIFRRHHTLRNKIPSDYIKIMNEIINIIAISTDDVQSEYPKYIMKSFEKWTDSVGEASFNNEHIKKYAVGLAIWEENNNLMLFDVLNKIFKKAEGICIHKVGKLDATSLKCLVSAMKSINNLKYSKLRYICMHGGCLIGTKCEFQIYKESLQQIGWKITDDGHHISVAKYIN